MFELEKKLRVGPSEKGEWAFDWEALNQRLINRKVSKDNRKIILSVAGAYVYALIHGRKKVTTWSELMNWLDKIKWAPVKIPKWR